MQRFVALAREVHRVAEVVIIEGSLAVVAADTALATEREHVLYQAVKSFRSAARDVLGTQDQGEPAPRFRPPCHQWKASKRCRAILSPTG
ncbi:hypothetical protein GCM10010433_17250 [Streptomyces pulveraceus]|uniref:Uncharacterized protein n=1 Tax=Streptomyces pulveraceus TaxID=68258 RepID=A0ABW1GMC5_9ACTN